MKKSKYSGLTPKERRQIQNKRAKRSARKLNKHLKERNYDRSDSQ